jgi:Holliday junction resolvase-like predicted endonuclease
MNSKATTGARGEAIATEYLRQNGYLICNRNWRSGHYEIDIVATKLGITHIIEVRTRKAGALLSPEKSITLTRLNLPHLTQCLTLTTPCFSFSQRSTSLSYICSEITYISKHNRRDKKEHKTK